MTNLSDIRSSGASAAGIGTTVYNSVSALPSTGLTSGDQAFVESAGASGQSRLYISQEFQFHFSAFIYFTTTKYNSSFEEYPMRQKYIYIS